MSIWKHVLKPPVLIARRHLEHRYRSADDIWLTEKMRKEGETLRKEFAAMVIREVDKAVNDSREFIRKELMRSGVDAVSAGRIALGISQGVISVWAGTVLAAHEDPGVFSLLNHADTARYVSKKFGTYL